MKLSLWICIGLSLLLVIILECLWIKHQSSEISTYKAYVETFKDTQKTNLATINDLQAANAKWASDSAVQIENGKAYTKAAVDYALQQQAKASKANHTLQAIYAHDPSARAWANTSVDRSIEQQLRANSGSD